MLGKLIRYEFKASGRLIPLTYVVVGLLAIAGAALSYTRMTVYITISFVLLFLAGAAAVIITYIIIIMRFHKGMFGSEGYLANTLPVTPEQLYLSKMTVSFTWILSSGIVTILAWIAAFATLMGMVYRELASSYSYYGYSYSFWDIMDDLDWEVYEALRLFFSPRFILFMAVMALVGYVAFIAKIYFCLTIANVRPFQKLGLGSAVIAFIVIEIVDSILKTLLRYLFPLSLAFDSYSGWYFSSQSLWNSYQYSYFGPDFVMGVASHALPILYAVGLPILTIWLIKKKVNLK